MQTWRVTSGTPDPDTVGRLLRSLPGWFGLDDANAAYVESARRLATYRAWPAADGACDGQDGSVGGPVGVLLIARHFPESAEVHLMAVDPGWHRRGAGRALLRAAEADLAAGGVEFLQVKTLGPSHDDAGYAKTRAFYTAVGFRPLEELPDLWPGNPCLLMVKALRPR